MRRRTARNLIGLADGTLPPSRRERLLRRVSASPKLAQALKQQLIVIEAVRRLDAPAPNELHERIERATRAARATQQNPSPTTMTAHAGGRPIRSKRPGTPRC